VKIFKQPYVGMKKLKKNKGILFWITGLSGCGKTTIAKKIENNISKKYGPTIILSGDDLKKIFNYNKFKSAFNLTDSFLINSILGAVRLFFSISFKYDGATPI